jgi:two-component system, cell cycle sensor histidine kinase and response regulator CckA
MNPKPIRVLMVDESWDDFRSIQQAATSIPNQPSEIKLVATFREAEEILNQKGWDICLMDLSLAAAAGLELVKKTIEENLRIPLIFTTGMEEDEIDGRDPLVGDTDLLSKKKIDGPLLARSIRYALKHRQLREEIFKQSEQLHQSQKMETMGCLASAIVHDFNNLLAAINGNCQLLLSEEGSEEVLKEGIQEIRKIVSSGAELVKQLLLFGRKQTSQPVLLNLNRIVSEMEKMIAHVIGKQIEVQVRLVERLHLIKASSIQVQQILMNLATNARDAMPKGGSFIIETSNVRFEEVFHGDEAVIPAGSYVLLSVKDTGEGIPVEIRQRIFEPFFTTKGEGQGTGLGLSTIHDIIQKNGGYLWVQSVAGKGTTFSIYFPAIYASEVIKPKASEKTSAPREFETILLVEDDVAMLNTLTKLLTREGYPLVTAKDAEDCLQKVREYDKPVHLLITDIFMPGMNGKELSDRLKEQYPELKVIFYSGRPLEVIVAQGIQVPKDQFLSKPISLSELNMKIKEVLSKD